MGLGNFPLLETYHNVNNYALVAKTIMELKSHGVNMQNTTMVICYPNNTLCNTSNPFMGY